MTDHFEVVDRDGPARIGELRLDPPVTTPALVDDRLRDAGSLWSADRDRPEPDQSTLTLLPHRAFPAGAREAVVEAFRPDTAARDAGGPTAAVTKSDAARDVGADAYFLSDVQGFLGHGRAVREAIVATRESLPPDVGVGLSGAATPANVATLAWTGVDLFDRARARAKGAEGRYLTADGERFLDNLTELPCGCPACATPPAEFGREECIEHNVAALEAELRRVRVRIREGRLREYLEGQARHEAWLTATFREFDDQYGYLEERTPVVRGSELLAATEDALRRVEIQRFADRVASRYCPRFDAPLVLVPCSARKPYSDSRRHAQFHDAIGWRGHVVSMTSPIGVVPQELELTYPAQHYDAVVTGRWTAGEVEFVAAVLRRYLEGADYPRIVAHVPDDGYREVCDRATETLEVPVEYTVAGHPTDEESLSNLEAALEGEPAYPKREREHNTVRAIADYMFGTGAGDDVFGSIRTTGRYPKLQVRDPGRDRDDDQLAAIVPQYGVLSFTLAGARRWVESDAPTKRVRIDEFVPRGSVLAPGVTRADGSIRVGDEVVVEGPAAFGVGRAGMSGPEMTDATRGVAVTVRHVEER